MGGGISGIVKKVEKYGKEAVKAQTRWTGGGLLNPGGGGAGGKAAETVSQGSFQSKDTKSKIAAATQAQNEQQAILDKQMAEIQAEEDDRKKRMLRTRQGRRALLFSGSGESGVAGIAKQTILGG